jgi:small nuclear ribonucleoprotein (snRNP)-like protein
VFNVFAMTINLTAITIIFIVLATAVAAFVRRKSRDKCLRDFEQNTVTLEETSGKIVWGELRVENTGLEFVYPQVHKDEKGHIERSYILYKYEYPNIGAVIRFHDELSETNKKKREIELKRTYHPRLLRRLKRKILNIFKTVRDSVVEVVNLMISQAKKATPAGKVLSSQDKYVSQMKHELMGSVGTSFEPLLERYIGHKVVLELIKGDKLFEYSGVLKEYTAEFIEVMDINYSVKADQPLRKADLVVPRKHGIVRHLGE